MAERACDLCGESPAIPVAYGLPSQDLMERAERGDVLLGGCEIDDAKPHHLCARCAASGADPDESPESAD